MAEGPRNMDAKRAALPDGEDRLSALPEDVVLLVLSFLRSPEVVRTCVLASRWRNLWKSVPSLLISSLCSPDFVNSLLRYRDPTPLNECVLLVEDVTGGESHRDAERWLRYVVSCKVRVLCFDMLADGLQLSAGALASEHLKCLDLFRIEFGDSDVSSCQSLKKLDITQCVINIGNIGTDLPKSLRLLRIRDTSFLPKGTWSSISAPGLVTLELVDCLECTPFIKSMPSLVTALIRIGHDRDHRVVLIGLSGATNLELLSPSFMIFRWEFKWGLMFRKLKTLLLCDWFMTANFSGLVYFLEHSPVLEMLTLQISNSENSETGEDYKPKKQFLVSKHLKAVKIKYCEEVGKIDQILNVLAYHGVQPELINIERRPFKDCYYFRD